MAKENIAKFFDAVITDKALAEKVIALAAENSYDFTAEELLEFGKARPLDDAAVEAASGGVYHKLPDMKWMSEFLQNRNR